MDFLLLGWHIPEDIVLLSGRSKEMKKIELSTGDTVIREEYVHPTTGEKREIVCEIPKRGNMVVAVLTHTNGIFSRAIQGSVRPSTGQGTRALWRTYRDMYMGGFVVA